jgi:hypothetical protein
MSTQVPETEHDSNNGERQDIKEEKTDRIVKDDKVELQDTDAWDKLGYSFPTWRKWQILSKLLRRPIVFKDYSSSIEQLSSSSSKSP